MRTNWQSYASVQALAIDDMGKAIEKSREINFKQARSLIAYRIMMIGWLPQCETTVSVLTPWLTRDWRPAEIFWANRN